MKEETLEIKNNEFTLEETLGILELRDCVEITRIMFDGNKTIINFRREEK